MNFICALKQFRPLLLGKSRLFCRRSLLKRFSNRPLVLFHPYTAGVYVATAGTLI